MWRQRSTRVTTSSGGCASAETSPRSAKLHDALRNLVANPSRMRGRPPHSHRRDSVDEQVTIAVSDEASIPEEDVPRSSSVLIARTSRARAIPEHPASAGDRQAT